MPMAICPTNFATLLQIWLFLLSFLPYEPFPVLSTSTTMNEMIMQIDSLVFLFRDCFLSSQIKNLAIILVVVVEALVVIMVMMLIVFMVVRVVKVSMVVKVFIVFMLFMVVEVVMVVKVVGQD